MHQDSFETISALDLGGVVGGMQWESFPRSSNIEDARGMTPGQASRAFPGGGGGGGQDPGGGGALGQQLGIDRIGQSPVNAGGGGGGGW